MNSMTEHAEYKARVEHEAIAAEIRASYPDNREGRRAAERAVRKALGTDAKGHRQ